MKLCECGCGKPTTPAFQKQKGYLKGEYQRFVRGHGTVRKPRHVRQAEGYCRHAHNLRVVGTHPNGDCRECSRISTRKTYLKYPNARTAARRLRVFKTYGLTADQFDALMLAQDGKCAICRRLPSEKKKTLHIDHDHVSGRVRGLLCHECNLAVGKMHDDPALFRAAAVYLDQASRVDRLKAV